MEERHEVFAPGEPVLADFFDTYRNRIEALAFSRPGFDADSATAWARGYALRSDKVELDPWNVVVRLRPPSSSAFEVRLAPGIVAWVAGRLKGSWQDIEWLDLVLDPRRMEGVR